MPAVQVRCPNCSRSYSVDGRLLGKLGRCKQCGVRGTLESSDGAGRGSAQRAPASGSVPEMPRRLGRFEVHARPGLIRKDVRDMPSMPDSMRPTDAEQADTHRRLRAILANPQEILRSIAESAPST